MLKKVFLGSVDYFGQQAKAYRVIYPDRWEFVLETRNKELTLISY